MEFAFINLLKQLLMPLPALLLLSLAGLGLLLFNIRYGYFVTAMAVLLLFSLSLPLVAKQLIRIQESYQPLDSTSLDSKNYQAIVVLGGGVLQSAPEFAGEDTVNFRTLQRIRYAAKLAHETGLPILVSGGGKEARNGSSTEAEVMTAALQNEFGVNVKWFEDRSRNTAENALFSHHILAEHQVTRILLVTHATDMPRAAEQFKRVGFDVLPAPTVFISSARNELSLYSFIPSASALKSSTLVIYELLGAVWYDIRYRE